MDPSLPTYVKIPARPISLSWAHTIKPFTKRLPMYPKGSNYYEVNNISSMDLTQYGSDFSAVYMDPPLLLPGEEPTPGKITIDEFVGLSKNKTIKKSLILLLGELECIENSQSRFFVYLVRERVVTKAC